MVPFQARFVLITEPAYINPQDEERCTILGQSVIEFSLDNSIRVDGSIFFNEVASNREFELADLALLEEPPNDFIPCSICQLKQSQKSDFSRTCYTLSVADPFAGGGGLLWGCSASGRMSPALAIDSSPSAVLTLRSVICNLFSAALTLY
jgi:hypothetical protein